MPSTPYIINGIIKNSNSVNIADARITLTTALGSVSGVSDSTGKYVLDLANADYTLGETISYSVNDKYNNEVYSGTFTATGTSTTNNVTLAERTDVVNSPGNTDIQIYNKGGKIVSRGNPLPVINIDLPENYKTTWVITRQDGQPNSETIVLRGETYKRTFTYTNNIMTERSEWVKQ